MHCFVGPSPTGYLLAQFCASGTNTRTDAYGGSVENRCRLPLEVVAAVAAAVGDASKVGIRIAPFNSFNDVKDANPLETYTHLITELNKLGVGYVHCVNSARFDADAHGYVTQASELEVTKQLKAACSSAFILAGGFQGGEQGAAAIREGRADAVCYGRVYLANPDLPKRFALGAALNKYDRDSFYTQDGVAGYTDYPFLGEEFHAGVAAVDPHPAAM